MGLLGDIFKTVVDVATLPVSVAADIVTLGGELTDRDSTYTGQHIGSVIKDIEDVIDDL